MQDGMNHRNVRPYVDHAKFDAAISKPAHYWHELLKDDTDGDPTFFGLVEHLKEGGGLRRRGQWASHFWNSRDA